MGQIDERTVLRLQFAKPCKNCVTCHRSEPIDLGQLGSSGPICKHLYSYDNFGMSKETDDYGSTGPGGLLRRVITTYAALGSVHAFAQTIQVQDGANHSSRDWQPNYFHS